ncbi:CBS-domain-containing membrane protein [Desulfosporosinus orientis DSM 765]|uniref:CBS-domain-containing membrane protein n=2 Tax=Desulfosporosinus orientis TaxID=1563 RepID=G7W7V8_DESOD|nr:CBS-domain-containing membrane protein [Desulfosporosinus orientis DSM 765]
MQQANESRDLISLHKGKTMFLEVPTWLNKYLSKLKGHKRTTPLVTPPPLDVILTWLGAFLGITAIALFAQEFSVPIVASFGASAVLVYGVPDAPLSQPRNVIMGHILSAVAGVSTFLLFGLTWWSPALGTALALVIMILTKTTHPPGGATALFAVLSKAHPFYVFNPIALGAVILVVIGLIVNNLSPNRQYPKYWF